MQNHKVVLLHGWLQNAEIFKAKSAGFRKQLKNLVNSFEFIDAPFFAETDGVGKKFENNTEYRTWIFPNEDRTIYRYWRKSIKYTLEEMKDKSFTGMMAFSQGCFIASIICTLISLEKHKLLNRENLPSSLFEEGNNNNNNTTIDSIDPDDTNFDEIIDLTRKVFFHPNTNEINLKYVVFIGGFKPRANEILELYNVLFKNNYKLDEAIKTLHIYGENDKIVTPERSKEFAETCFGKPLILTHPKQHILPTGEGFDKEALRGFIQSSL
ncbi:hypothetical protein ABK040_001502 [Willaertia magna]